MESGRRLLTFEEYREIVKAGREAEVLFLYVKRKRGPRKKTGRMNKDRKPVCREAGRREIEDALQAAITRNGNNAEQKYTGEDHERKKVE